MALYEGFDMPFVKMPKYLATNKYQNKDLASDVGLSNMLDSKLTRRKPGKRPHR